MLNRYAPNVRINIVFVSTTKIFYELARSFCVKQVSMNANVSLVVSVTNSVNLLR